MALLVTLVGALIAVLGVAIGFSPRLFIDWISGMNPRTRFLTAVVVRAVFGAVFLFAAPACRWPGAVQVIGVLSLVAAAAIGVMGQNRLDALISWWTARPHSVMRLGGVFAIGFGALLVYAGG